METKKETVRLYVSVYGSENPGRMVKFGGRFCGLSNAMKGAFIALFSVLGGRNDPHVIGLKRL